MPPLGKTSRHEDDDGLDLRSGAREAFVRFVRSFLLSFRTGRDEHGKSRLIRLSQTDRRGRPGVDDYTDALNESSFNFHLVRS